jgi:surfactin synthase thioesterase subunit
MSGSLASPWFVTEPGPGPWTARIFCFPPAGGSPRAFLAWQDDLKHDAEIVAICRPGQDHRAAEPAPTIREYIEGAAAAIAAAARTDRRPSYLFGHGLGALVAFEVCRTLIGDREVIPRHFVASGCPAPSIAESRLAAGYRHLPAAPLAIPATLVVGRDDPHVREETVAPWAREFAHPIYRHWISGGHFYFEDRPETIIEILSQVIRADQRGEPL